MQHGLLKSTSPRNPIPSILTANKSCLDDVNCGVVLVSVRLSAVRARESELPSYSLVFTTGKQRNREKKQHRADATRRQPRAPRHRRVRRSELSLAVVLDGELTTRLRTYLSPLLQSYSRI